MKLVSHLGTCPGPAARLVDDYTRSRDVFLQQPCLEFQALLTTAPEHLGDVFPIDASCEDVGADPDLAIMDDYVAEAVKNGAARYAPPADSDSDDEGGAVEAGKPAFNLTPYAKPERGARGAGRSGGGTARGEGGGEEGGGTGGGDGGGGGGGGGGETASQSQQASKNPPALGLRMGNVANVWGPPPVAPPPPSPPPSARPAPPRPPPSPPSASAASPPALAAVAPPEEEEEEVREMTDKEKMAAALFGGTGGGGGGGGMGGGGGRGRRGSGEGRRRGKSGGEEVEVAAPVVPAAPPPPAPAPPPPPPPAPPPAPPPPPVEADLLDMMSFNDSEPTGEAQTLPPPAILDVLTPSNAHPPAAPLSSPAPPAVSTAVYRHNGHNLTPLNVDTAGFGARWGQCPHTAKVTKAKGGRIGTLDDFMSAVEKMGGGGVEAIPETNEAIAAGLVGDDAVVLIHLKIREDGGCDVTVKSSGREVGEGCREFIEGGW